RSLPARRCGSRRTSVQSVSLYPSPLAPWLKLRVNHLISGTAPLPAIPARTACTPCRLLSIAARGQAGGELLQVTRQLPQLRHVSRLLLHELTNLLNHTFGAGPLMHGRAVTKLVQLTLNLISHGIGLVARLYRFALSPILGSVPLRVSHHAINLLLRELRGATNRDTL